MVGFSRGNGEGFAGERAPEVESHPVFSPALWAGVSSAVLEVHVGTSSVFAVEGQRAVLPVWYTSPSQKQPFIVWLLDQKDRAPFQVRGGEGTWWGKATRRW